MAKSTFMTGVAIANSMVGSSMIIFPVTYNDTGVLVNILFLVHLLPPSSSWQPSWLSPANFWSRTFTRTNRISDNPFAASWVPRLACSSAASLRLRCFWFRLCSSCWQWMFSMISSTE